MGNWNRYVLGLVPLGFCKGGDDHIYSDAIGYPDLSIYIGAFIKVYVLVQNAYIKYEWSFHMFTDAYIIVSAILYISVYIIVLF